MVEHGEGSTKNKGKKRPRKDTKDMSNKKPKGAYWICGKPGHFKRDCRAKQGVKRTHNNRSKQGSNDQSPPSNQGQNLDFNLNSVKNLFH